MTPPIPTASRVECPRFALRRWAWFAVCGWFGAVGLAAGEPVRLITLDPGHFHAALLQKEMLPGIDPTVHVYAPLGPDLLAHLGRVHGFNSRAENPTRWVEEVHAGPDFFSRLLAERPGNVAIVSGQNRDKIVRLRALVDAGLAVLADKPWIIEPTELPALAATLRMARERRIAIYDAMTQRFEVSCQIQKELVNDAAIFGACQPGSAGAPAVSMVSVHYLKKEVAGQPLLRPAWFFDPRQQGEPLADVGTHLVDLVQWTLSAERPLDYTAAIKVQEGERHWLNLSREQFRSVTGLAEYPGFLREYVRGDQLATVGRNVVGYTLRGVHVKLDVIWDYVAPAGGRDTELAIYRGTRARVEVRQGKEENYVPEVFVVPASPANAKALAAALEAWRVRRASAYPGVEIVAAGAEYHVKIPAALRISHEAHFAQLVGRFLELRANPDLLPAWETDFMLAKYHVTTEGVRLGRIRDAARPAAVLP